MQPDLHQPEKAGLSGLFLCGLWSAAFLLVVARTAAAAPLAITVVSAEAVSFQPGGEPVISFKMSDVSSRAFTELTQQNVGRKLEIRIDGRTISAPVIREPIFGGTGQISGHFTEQQARDIAARLSSGAAKLEFEIVK